MFAMVLAPTRLPSGSKRHEIFVNHESFSEYDVFLVAAAINHDHIIARQSHGRKQKPIMHVWYVGVNGKLRVVHGKFIVNR